MSSGGTLAPRNRGVNEFLQQLKSSRVPCPAPRTRIQRQLPPPQCITSRTYRRPYPLWRQHPARIRSPHGCLSSRQHRDNDAQACHTQGDSTRTRLREADGERQGQLNPRQTGAKVFLHTPATWPLATPELRSNVASPHLRATAPYVFNARRSRPVRRIRPRSATHRTRRHRRSSRRTTNHHHRHLR